MDKGSFDRRSPSFVESARTVSQPLFTAGALNELLRMQLAPVKPHADLHTPAPQTESAARVAVDVVAEILQADAPNRASLNEKLSSLFARLTETYYQAAIPVALRKRQYIARHGLVISPDNCITSILDVYRVRAFIRGVHKALAALRSRVSGPVHIVYPACGPYAPLLLPLLSFYRDQGLYTSADLQVTLIDMQKGAVDSLHAVIKTLDVQYYIRAIHCCDAMEFDSKHVPIHMLVLEAMQHGFSREGHLPLARHFAALLEPDGVLIPQEVSIRAVLNTGQEEYVEQWRNVEACEYALMDQKILAERCDLGEIFSVTPQSLRALQVKNIDEYTALVECGTVTIPKDLSQADQQLLLLCSQVRTFGDEWVREYDSGITHPLPDEQICIDFAPREQRLGDLLVKRGDKLKFYYRLNGLPGFFATREEV